MLHLVLTIVFFVSKQCSGQLGYGGSGYCSNCASSNSGSTSQGFGFGGGSYVNPSNTANSGLTSQNSYSLLTNNGFILPSNYVYGTNGYGAGASYGSAKIGSALNHGSSSGMPWNNAYNSAGNYGTRNGYISCNNNCLSSTGINTVRSSTGYGISGINSVYNSYSSLSDPSHKTYLLPSTYIAYSNLGSVPNTYTGNRHSDLEASYSLPIIYNNYPGMYSSYGSESGINFSEQPAYSFQLSAKSESSR